MKRDNFDSNLRRHVFRYGISGSKNVDCMIGGLGELGGNDFIEYDHVGGTIMHEFGHNLNLRHGGNDDHNCKPNYVSVMNYDHSRGIRQTGASSNIIIDYSPPRFPGGRGRGVAPLPTLVEDHLDEAIILDVTDPVNWFVSTTPDGRKVQRRLNGDSDGDGPGDGDGDRIGDGVDWNDDGIVPNSPVPPVNIDTKGNNGSSLKCANTSANSTLTGYDDWTNIALSFHHFGDSAAGPINPVTEREPTLEELNQLEQELNTTNLSLTKTPNLSSVPVGTDLIYTLKVTNKGPNPASRVKVIDTLPAGVSFKSAPSGCIGGATSPVVCQFGELLAGASQQFSITVGTAGACATGAPATLTNTATVTNVAEFAGPDLTPSDNSVTATATAVDTTPPVISAVSASPAVIPSAPNHKMVPVTVSVAVTDVCDPRVGASCQLLAVTSSEPINGLGDGDMAPDWQTTGKLTANLRAERSGSGRGRVYTLTVQCKDASGNSATKATTVTVPR